MAMAGWFSARPTGTAMMPPAVSTKTATASPDTAPTADELPGYNAAVESFREREYPMLRDAIYLDHAGTTLYSRSLVDRFAADMTASLLGNPHAGSASSQASSALIEDVRLRALQWYGADPAEFDLVFVANATAGAKLVAEACRAQRGGFSYAYHEACHTSLVGVRAEARRAACVTTEGVGLWETGKEPEYEVADARADEAEDDAATSPTTTLFAYTAQSNMDGQRYPLAWASRVRQTSSKPLVLLDAAAYGATSPLDLSDVDAAPDFVLVSFYKAFGFPDLAALLVRRAAEPVFDARRYFGGGTVDAVVCGQREQWHATRRAGGAALHERLEDGTLPVHAILALRAALDVHTELYGGMPQVAAHAGVLADRMRRGLADLRHGNGRPVCVLYGRGDLGPTVAFNVRNARGAWIGLAEFEKLATLKQFHIRTGGVCNPGGIAAALDLAPWEVRRNLARGLRCSGADDDSDVVNGKPTGVVRASLGAMSTVGDVDRFVAFVEEFFREAGGEGFPVKRKHDEGQERKLDEKGPGQRNHDDDDNPLAKRRKTTQTAHIAAIAVYPIKSCGAFSIPPATPWPVRPEGLAWDREWCLVHRGSRRALSQKQYPQMVRLRPALDFEEGVLRVVVDGDGRSITVPLSQNPSLFLPPATAARASRVCGEAVAAQVYASPAVHAFFSEALGVPCLLARFPASGGGGDGPRSTRHAKEHLGYRGQAAMTTTTTTDTSGLRILLANESPILGIHLASLRALNRALGPDAAPVPAAVFRANIVLDGDDAPYAEDGWTRLRVGPAGQAFRMLGACRRCHMVCVDQATGTKREEPFLTLAKTRRFDGKVFFGAHMAHEGSVGGAGGAVTPEQQHPTIAVGDAVEAE